MATPAGQATTPVSRPARRGISGLPVPSRQWLAIFGVSLALFLVRFLVPVPVGQADNRDGPRLMCGLGLAKVVTPGYPRFFRYAYFEYLPSKGCAGRVPYPSSEVLPLEIARVLTPLFGLAGTLNLIALGVLFCVLASAGIASLVTGLRLPLWGRLLAAAAVWLIMADAAFFDVFASPFSEPAALVGLLLLAAGLLYLGRGWRSAVTGLVLAGSGGFLAILSKEQYLIWALPVCVTIVLASTQPAGRRWRRRFRTREVAASVLVAAFLAILAAGYWVWQDTSRYGLRLQHIQIVDMIFTDLVTKRSTAGPTLRALGLPLSWAEYAGHYYWHTDSVRTSPLLRRYEPELTDANITRYLLAHPGKIISVGQTAAVLAQQVHVTALGDYPVYAHRPPGAYETRVFVFTWLAQRLPRHLGLALYLPLWAAMGAVGIVALGRRRRAPWHREAAIVVLCMTSCAITGFIPPAYYAGISTTRHMVGMNLATALALTISVVLLVSFAGQALTRRRPARPAGTAAVTRSDPASAKPVP